jgi:hypothetical protein
MHILIEPSAYSSRAMSTLCATEPSRREAMSGRSACAAVSALPWSFNSSFYAVGLYEGKNSHGARPIAVSLLAKISFERGQPLYGHNVLNLSYAVSLASEGKGLASLVSALGICSLARMNPAVADSLVSIQAVSTNVRSLRLARKILGLEGRSHPDVHAPDGECVQGGYTTFANALRWGQSVIDEHRAEELLAAVPCTEPAPVAEVHSSQWDARSRRRRESVSC